MFETLLGLVGDNAEAKAEIAKLQKTVTDTIDQDKAKISSLESQFEAVKTEKEKYKAGNALVKKALGVSQINEETISSKLKEIGSDESAQKLAQELAAKDAAIEELKAANERAIAEMQIEIELDKAINSASEILSDDPIVRKLFKKELQEKVGVVDGNVLPLQTVGDQKIPVVKDGKPLALGQFAKEMLETDYAALRKPTVKQSTGNTGGGSGGQSLKGKFGGTSEELEAAVGEMLKREGM